MHTQPAPSAPTEANPIIKSNTKSESNYQVKKRSGQTVPFSADKITVAISKAMLAVEGQKASGSQRIHDAVQQLTDQVLSALQRSLIAYPVVHIEDIQDQVELALMRSGHHKVARAYVLYRTERAQQRASSEASPKVGFSILESDGQHSICSLNDIEALLHDHCDDLTDVSVPKLLKLIEKSIFDGISRNDFNQSLVLAARGLIDLDPDYSKVTARLLLQNLRDSAFSYLAVAIDNSQDLNYADYFHRYIHTACKHQYLDEELKSYDLERLADALNPSRDRQFEYLGLQTLTDRYFIKHNTVCLELPQAFFMRVAMGLSINEVDREARAIEFYNVLSSFDFMASTPTLFNSGTLRPQLSSCYLTTVPDDLSGIYSAIHDNALLSKFAGGLGNDWSRVRGLGAVIKGTHGQSQGVVPFLKVANDTAVAVNQGGKRKGAVCAYLETWHIDVEDFLDLRKNTGDERRRTHDMNTANWIPDLFMQRVVEDQMWTLFSPDDTPDLHDLVGNAFKQRYEYYEAQADAGQIPLFRRLKAVDLWRKMLSMLFETGHPWITFKDACNVRYTNQHQGVVHSSNLCTEITLHTNDDEIAVCNLGSINLVNHLVDGEIDQSKLETTVRTAMRMLDNVIEYNYYSVPQARRSNLKHRPVGLGVMGFQDALYLRAQAYDSDEATQFADKSMEAISYYAIQASNELAQERGTYPSYDGSLWSQGILPIDSIDLLEKSRSNYLDQDRSQTLDWDSLRSSIKQTGMRNSNCLAIAPTATISNICGLSQSIEPTYQNLYVKSNLSGEFTVVNKHLVTALKNLGLWDDVMVNDLKYYDGSVQAIERIPDHVKALFKNAFELDTRWLIEAASRRQKWLDQAQSLNLYLAEPSGKKLDQIYKLAWVRGLKTTYYLRSLGATQMEKATSQSIETEPTETKVCSILDPDCDACQ
ncbi:ribonucleoside-diphosphate reductase [Arenicella chitinivorans]|uniref:Ribonucleoside-diphosphate reductase n=1 Tax=Arenicella chitinivorans TaxID=1329800 RepID=A0A918RR77_9GAMM|nr:ribonucleoside-diphosphate reductase subunit alpha [Arenicella chitinivorans]GHA06694.1 ribonucleoside-diphosphate reductase [Arenicella chitinivorans]